MKSLCAVGVTLLAAGAASAQLVAEFEVPVNFIDDIPSLGPPGDVANFEISVPLSQRVFGLVVGVDLIGIRYDVTIEAVSPSWLSDAGMGIDSVGTPLGNTRPFEQIFFVPFAGFDFSGTESRQGSLDLSPFSNLTLAVNNTITLEFAERFDDFFGPDAFWQSGSRVFLRFRGPFDAGGCNPADIAEPFGVLSNADVSLFVDLFFEDQPYVGALADPTDSVSQADVTQFVRQFFEGCAD